LNDTRGIGAVLAGAELIRLDRKHHWWYCGYRQISSSQHPEGGMTLQELTHLDDLEERIDEAEETSLSMSGWNSLKGGVVNSATAPQRFSPGHHSNGPRQSQ
jgi:hypothetical protein